MDSIVIGGVVVNGTLFMLVTFFVQRWMNRMEKDREDDREEVRRIANEVAERAENTARTVAEKAACTSVEIKERIESNRLFYAQSYTDIKCSIDKLAEHVGKQNGRLGRLETDLAKQVESCKIRNASGKHK